MASLGRIKQFHRAPTLLLIEGFAAALIASAPGSVAPAQKNPVKVNMQNVLYHFTDQVAVHISILHGDLVPAGSSAIPMFDDKNSFVVRITQAEIAISSASLANMLNSDVFARADSPLKSISIHVQNGELKVKGKLHSKGDIPFEMDGAVDATSDGKIRIHPRTIKAFHLPVKGIMDLFGVELAGLIKTDKVPGVQARGDDIVLDPQRTLPPPHIEGKVTRVRLEGEQIVQSFGTPNRANIEAAHENYMQYRGNRLRFGKLTMDDTDLTLLDMNPQDPFDFYLDHYKDQLVAGYTKITPTFGLRVYMRDYDKLSHSH